MPLGGLHQRTSLAYLLLHANKVVATSKLVDAVWRHQGPPTARKMLHNAIGGIREMLAASRIPDEQVALVTRNPGYLLRVDPNLVDLHRFNQLVRSARAWRAARAWAAAAAVLREAMALWRGPVLADLVEAGIEWPDLSAIRNARLSAFEDQMDAELAIGRHHDVIGQLEWELTCDPMRERICGQLMIALYRSGRQADALRVYQHTRRTLVEQMGLDPSPELRQLQQSILDHDMTPVDASR